MNLFLSIKTIEVVLTIVHYIAIISLMVIIGQIVWTLLFSIDKEKQNS